MHEYQTFFTCGAARLQLVPVFQTRHRRKLHASCDRIDVHFALPTTHTRHRRKLHASCCRIDVHFTLPTTHTRHRRRLHASCGRIDVHFTLPTTRTMDICPCTYTEGVSFRRTEDLLNRGHGRILCMKMSLTYLLFHVSLYNQHHWTV